MFNLGCVSTDKDMDDLIFGHASFFQGTFDAPSWRNLSTSALKIVVHKNVFDL